MFRIAFESIYMVGLASLGVLTLAATRPSLGTIRGGTTATRSILIATAVLQLAMVIAAAGSRYRFRRNRMDRKRALRAITAEVQDDLKLSGLVGLLIAAYAIGPAVDAPSSIATCIAVSAPALVWATLYFTGRSDGRENARSLSPPASVLLFGAAAALACLTAALRVSPRGTLDTRVATAWAAATLLPSILMAFRAHERALIGSFSTQTTWMRVNRRRLMAAYGLQRTQPPPTSSS
jgi:hypothetical protein